jgi:WS/DGAT/MGAT family acyltransferase
MKQLGGLDASFLYMETPQTPMHVAGLSIVELPAGFKGDFYEAYKAHIASRLHLMPVLRMKLVQVPLEIDHPLWIDDDAMDLDYHVRHLGLPQPGTMRQLEELVGRLHSNFLDRSRPLWEFYVIDGLEGGRLAIYTKLHHAAVDGGAGMALTNLMYDTTPVPRPVEPPPSKPAGTREKPDALGLLGAAYRHVLSQQVSALQKIPDVLKALANVASQGLSLSSPLLVKGLPSLTAPKTMLNQTITSQRAFAARSMPLADAKAIAKQTETKLNDVVMAVCSGALRRYLLEKHGLPAEPLVAMVPVSLREPGNTETNNQVSGMLCNLATDVADPLERLQAIRTSTLEAKEFSGKIKDATPRDFAIFGLPVVMQGAMGLYGRSGLADQLPPSANVVISNVPGPPTPLYVAGAKVLTLYPVSIPTHGVALNLTVQSYNGALDFGLTACRKTVPELDKLAGYIEESLQELKEAALGEAPPVAASATPSRRRRAAPAAASAKTPTATRKRAAAPAKVPRRARSKAPAKASTAAKPAAPAKAARPAKATKPARA